MSNLDISLNESTWKPKRTKKVLLICLIFFVILFPIGWIFFTALFFRSSISTQYDANDVYASVFASCTIGKQSIDLTTDGTATGEREVLFNPGEISENYLFLPMDNNVITLTAQNKFMLLVYSFQNQSLSNDMYITLTYIDNEHNDKNFNFFVSDVENSLVINPATIGTLQNPTKKLLTNGVVPCNSIRYVFVRLEIANLTNNAELSGIFNWSLTSEV